MKILDSIQFVAGVPDDSLLYIGVYDSRLVAVSIVIAIVASYAALNVSSRAKVASGTLERFGLLATGAVTLGGGTWAMHFIGMLALILPCNVSYDPLITAASMIPGVLASAVALWLVNRCEVNGRQLIVGSLLLGAGIGAMHYSGMAAMRLDGLVRYDPGLFLASIVVAVALAFVALASRLRLKHGRWHKLIAAVAMGCAVSGMHYTAMAAAYFIRDGGDVSPEALNPRFLAAVVVFVTSTLIALVLVGAVAHRQLVLARQLRASEQKLRRVLDTTQEGFWVIDNEGITREVNAAMCALLGRPAEAIVNRPPFEFADAANADLLRQAAALPLSGRAHEFTVSLMRPDGSPVHCSFSAATMRDENGNRIGAFALVTDIGHIRESQAALHKLAHFDVLTGLANRSLLGIQLAHALDRAEREQTQLAVLMLDLDGFKDVNDSLGHPVGDQLLKTVAKRLQCTLRSVDTVARLGGDEFAVILESFDGGDDVASVAGKLIAAIALPYVLGSHTAQITTSIGIAIFPSDGEDEVALMRSADTALYAAKRDGRNAYRFHDAQMAEKVRARVAIEQGLRAALAEGSFEVWYQPKLDLRSRQVIGAEALVRWRHPQRGLISPIEFIPVAEETGLIVPIGEWVLREACRQTIAWATEGIDIGSIAVNIDGAQIERSNIVETVERALADTGMAPQQLELEITESLLLENAERGMGTVAILHEMGVGVAIDDFGTGYSSLAYLKYLRADRLKIDRSFVKDLPGNSDDATIARAVINLANNLGFSVIAEGVETEEQEAFLLAEGCFEVQGYRYAKPLPVAEFAAWFRKRAASA